MPLLAQANGVKQSLQLQHFAQAWHHRQSDAGALPQAHIR